MPHRASGQGLGQFSASFKHALRNAVLPVVTYLGPLLAYTLTGSFVVEKIFTIPGWAASSSARSRGATTR